MTKPLHRSRTFWFALAGLLLLLGMWGMSLWRCWYCHGSLRSGNGILLNSGPGVIVVAGFSDDDLVPRSTFQPSVRFEAKPPDFNVPWFPKPQGSIRVELTAKHPPAYFREAVLALPHWLIVILYLLAWYGTLGWSRRRQRRLAAAAAIPDAVCG